MRTLLHTFRIPAALLALLACGGCSSTANMLNPFYETPPPIAFAGQPNDHALNEGGSEGKAALARNELDQIGRYPEAHAPQPVNPVVQPAVIRLMWVPDHLSANGDLVPAHYYYLKVLDDRWAVTDVFEQQELVGSKGTAGSALPFKAGKGK
ncbi:MAG: hypothetical protein KDD64_09245 [Bdellovibrionales bacterium]|nr:hypothetical protein [Bdellovibrionales bacterium]